jgi:hexosaminidase
MKPRGGFLEFQGLPEIKARAGGESPFSREIETFRKELEADFKLKPGSAENSGGKAGIVCQKAEGLEDEAYCLEIGNGRINLAASAGAGLWHGLQTVRQLLLSGRDSSLSGPEGAASKGVSFKIPLAEIEDRPRFPWRGLMLDCSRYFYSTGFIKKLLSALSLHHINIFHWHLTDDQGWRLPVPAYPLLTEIGSKRREHRLHDRFTGGFSTEDEI